MGTTINTNYSVPNYTITEQTKARVLEGSKNAETSQSNANAKGAMVEISQDGMKSYKESLVKSATDGLQNSENGKGVIISDYSYMLSSKMPSIYGEKGEGGEYERHYYSVSEKSYQLLNAYAEIYDEIVTGHRDGTREIFVEDKTSEKGYRKLSMDEEIEELDKAFQKKTKKMEEREKKNKKDLEIINADREKMKKYSNGTSKIAKEIESMAKNDDSDVPENFSKNLIKAANIFVQQYKANRGMDINSLLSGISIFAKD